MRSGILYCIGAYLLWGFSPLYWKQLKHIPAAEILGHRMIWLFFFLIIILIIRRQWSWVPVVRQQPRKLFSSVMSAVLLAINWFTYIWAVNSGYVVEASLGYFINPLVSVFLGVIFLQERLRSFQWISIAIATTGMIYLTSSYGRVPIISLILAFSFGFYGLLRKRAFLGAIEGLTIESVVYFFPALFFLFFLESQSESHFCHSGLSSDLLLILGGLYTALPLIWFAAATRRITLTMIGLLQYLAPTIQFLLGIFLYDESFDKTKLIGFCIIWLALLLYTLEGLISRYCKKKYSIC